MSTQRTFREGLVGKKLGMTHVFSAQGERVPVTIIEAGPCYVLQIKNKAVDGYSGVQFGFEPKKAQRINKAETGHFGKAGKGGFYHVCEVRCDAEALGWNSLGKEVLVGDVFKDGEFVDVSGVSIGRGYAGVVRKYGVKGQPSTRGTHECRRHIGAVGQRKFPGHIFKNLSMPGHMGTENVTIQNLKVMGVVSEKNIILVKGAVPGGRGGLVVIRKSIKKGSEQASRKAA